MVTVSNQAHENDAERATLAGLGIVASMAGLDAEADGAHGVVLAVRVGISTGPVVVGDLIGEGAAEEAAVVGETPNLAARLQGVAEPNQVVIGSATQHLLGERFTLEDLGTHELKGLSRPEPVWQVVGVADVEDRYERRRGRGTSPLVGRQEELGLLNRSWEASKDGHGQVVLLQGQPGVGKSRLLDALREPLPDDDYIWVAIRCSPYHTNSALYPVIEHFKRVMDWQPEDDTERRVDKLENAMRTQSMPLEEVVPLFAELMSLALPEGRYPDLQMTPQQRREATLDAVVGWLFELAERKPVLQAWEDVHWADPTSLDVLGLYIEQSPTVSMLNVVTYRPEFAPPWSMRSHMMPITLNRLERPEVEAIVGHLAGGKSIPSEVLEHIVSKADGVPLYAEELTKSILDSEILEERADRYEINGTLADVQIPSTLQDSLMARLDRMPTLREVAQLGAVLGREFAYEVLRLLAPLEEPLLKKGLGHLVEDELLYQRGRPPRSRYIFKHALIQDAAYQSLLKRTRQQYHRQVAELLEERFPDVAETQPEQLAHHFAEAGMVLEAAEYWEMAGHRAVARSAHTEAITHFARGLTLIQSLPHTTEHARLELPIHLALGPVLMTTKGFASVEAEQAYVHATRLADEVGDDSQRFAALWGQFYVHELRAKWGEARTRANEVLALAKRLDSSGYILQGHHAAWTANVFFGDLRLAHEHAEQGRKLYDADTHRMHKFTYAGHDPGVCACVMQALALTLLGYLDQANARHQEALRLAEELAHPTSLTQAYFFLGLTKQWLGDVRGTMEHADRTVELGLEHGLTPFVKMGTLLRGWALAKQGEAGEGLGQMNSVLASARAKRRTALAKSYYLCLFADACSEQGQHQEGLMAIDEAFEAMAEQNEKFWEAELHRTRGTLLLAQSVSHGDDASACFAQAMEVASRQGAKLLELRAALNAASLLRDSGKPEEARDLLAPVYDWFTEGIDTADLKEAKALLDELS